MCAVSTEGTTLNPPCIWQTSLRGTPKMGSKRAGLPLMTEMAQLLRRRPGYSLKPSGILLEVEATEKNGQSTTVGEDSSYIVIISSFDTIALIIAIIQDVYLFISNGDEIN